MTKFCIPDFLVPLHSKKFDDFGVSRATLKNWMKKYRTQDGRKLGAKIGGQWYINTHALFDFLNEAIND